MLTPRICFAAMLPAVLLFSGVAAENKTRLNYETGYRIKAACLYSFAKFVEWPKGENSKPFTVGILGTDPFGDTLDKVVQQRSISGRAVVVRRLQNPQEARECDLVYLGSSSLMVPLMRAVEHTGVLTVGESERFTREGGMIGFVVVDDSVRFDVNTANASKSGLMVSARLLQLARSVVDGERGKP